MLEEMLVNRPGVEVWSLPGAPDTRVFGKMGCLSCSADRGGLHSRALAYLYWWPEGWRRKQDELTRPLRVHPAVRGL